MERSPDTPNPGKITRLGESCQIAKRPEHGTPRSKADHFLGIAESITNHRNGLFQESEYPNWSHCAT